MTEPRILIIDPEFKGLIPPLSQDEYAQLEKNILAEGCRDALIVWNEILLDGHNRYEICQKHELYFKISSKEFDSRQEAINWIINNQLGRRNLTPDQQGYLRGKRYNLVKESQGGDRKSEHVRSKDQNDTLITSADRLATELNVSPATIKRDGQFAEAVDTLREVAGIDPQALIDKANKQDVIELGKAVKSEIKAQQEPSLFVDDAKDTPAVQAVTEVQEAVQKGDKNGIKETVKKVVQDVKKPVFVPQWTQSQLERRKLVEQGITVVASLRKGSDDNQMDAALLAWADQQNLLVKIDRNTDWGNPFEMPSDGDRDTVCDNYARHYLPYKPSLLKKIPILKGKVLACWCHPERCHGDHLAHLANKGQE